MNRLRRWLAPALVFVAGSIAGAGAYALWFRSLPLLEAKRVYAEGKYDLAYSLAQAYLRQSVIWEPEAYAISARSAAHQRRWAEAEQSFQRFSPAGAEDLWLHARSLAGLKKGAAALAVLTDLLRVNPGHAQALHLSVILNAEHPDRADIALGLAERLAEIPSHRITAHLAGGSIAFQHGRFEPAIVHFEKALELSPTLDGQAEDFPKFQVSDALEFLVDACIVKRKYERAEPHARKLYQQRPTADSALKIARIMREQGKEREAMAFAETAVKKDGQLAAAAVLLGELKLDGDKFEEAETLFKRALALEPANATAKKALEWIQRRSAKPAASTPIVPGRE